MFQVLFIRMCIRMHRYLRRMLQLFYGCSTFMFLRYQVIYRLNKKYIIFSQQSKISIRFRNRCITIKNYGNILTLIMMQIFKFINSQYFMAIINNYSFNIHLFIINYIYINFFYINNLSLSRVCSKVFIIIMQKLGDNLQSVRDRILAGSLKILPKQYPLFTFLLGMFYNKFDDLNELFDIIQSLQSCRVENKLSQIYQFKILQILYNNPHLFSEVNKLISKIQKQSQVNVFDEIQRLQKIQNKQNYTNSTNNLQKSIEENARLSNSDTQEIIQQQRQYFESERLAKQMQQQEQRLARQQRVQDDAVCEICYVGLYESQFAFLQKCQHMFHIQCLQQSFKMQISENRFPLNCANDECKAQVVDSDIKIILTPQLYKKYQDHTLKSYADMNGDTISWCPTADCGYLFFYDKDDDDVRFQCIQCRKQYCLNCRVQWHKGMTCKEYKISSTVSDEDQKFLKFVKGKKFKQCPKCKFWVEKNQGCDHMTCKCGFQFCYKCGGIYGKCQCVQKFKQLQQRRRQQLQQKKKRKKQLEKKIKEATKKTTNRTRRK